MNWGVESRFGRRGLTYTTSSGSVPPSREGLPNLLGAHLSPTTDCVTPEPLTSRGTEKKVCKPMSKTRYGGYTGNIETLEHYLNVCTRNMPQPHRVPTDGGNSKQSVYQVT